jgi:hypothetical protein
LATEDASAFADFITDLLFTPAPARNFANADARFFSAKKFWRERAGLFDRDGWFFQISDLRFKIQY